MADEPTAAVTAPADTAATAAQAPPAAAELPANEGFEPEIIVLACHYCAYAAADLAGSMRLHTDSLFVARVTGTGHRQR